MVKAKNKVAAAWLYILKKNPKDLMRAVVDYFRVRPAFTYLLAISIFRFNGWSIAIILLGFVFDQCILEIYARRRSCADLLHILNGFIFVCENANLSSLQADKYHVSDYIDKETYDDLELNLLNRLTGLLGISWSLDKTMNIYHVRANGGVFNRQICYRVRPFNSYLFLQSSPAQQLNAFEKFTMLHELGHSILDPGAAPTAFALDCNKQYLVLLVFLAILLPWGYSSMLMLLISLSFLWLAAIIEKRIVLSRQKLVSETSADHFALHYLSMEDKNTLHQIFVKYPIKDSSMSDADNFKRNKTLTRNLKLQIEGEETDIFGDDKLLFKPSIAKLIICVVAILPLAKISKSITGHFIVGLVISCIILAFILAVCLLSTFFLDCLIKEKIKEWKPKEAAL